MYYVLYTTQLERKSFKSILNSFCFKNCPKKEEEKLPL